MKKYNTKKNALKLQEVIDENQILLLQLHQTQEALELYFLKYKELELDNSRALNSFKIENSNLNGEPIIDRLAMLERMEFVNKILIEINNIRLTNAIDIQLANILLSSTRSLRNLLQLPYKILKFWNDALKSSTKYVPQSSELELSISECSVNGVSEVERILKSQKVSSKARANIFTETARRVMKFDSIKAESLAYKAYECDPCVFRLKWLVFRTYDSGNVARADALLELLPSNIKYSESEKNHIRQIKYESSKHWYEQAKSKYFVKHKKNFYEKTIDDLKDHIKLLQDENLDCLNNIQNLAIQNKNLMSKLL